MNAPRHPSLYEINARIHLRRLARETGRPRATLDDIPDSWLTGLAACGFDWVYLMGVWETGEAGRRVSGSNEEWLSGYRSLLPDLREEDICGSGFAIADYRLHPDLGDAGALVRFRDRVHGEGLLLMLDFVPNHTALDHLWVRDHPDYYIRGTEEDLAGRPQDFTRVDLHSGSAVLAHGRDPYNSSWPDTLQLDYANPTLEEAMTAEIQRIAEWCDGVRCDMAMLLLPEVFRETWGRSIAPFWPKAIEAVHGDHPDFVFMAEVYWDLEWTLQQQGFDYTYDKRLYDRLRNGVARPVREHLRADLEYQDKSVRFLENHDEDRAAAVFPPDRHRAAAVLAYLCPGLRFFHQGQFTGRRKLVPVHLCREPEEPTDRAIEEFYRNLLTCLRLPAFRDGEWRLLDCNPAWEGNPSHDGYIAFARERRGERFVVAVNYAPDRGQCYVPLPWADLAGKTVRLVDLLGLAQYDRDGESLLVPGLYLDIPGWGCHVFNVDAAGG
ncbi:MULTISPECIES: alpha-amylase family glycosyl hydrolase [unclassified Methanoculleus]|uniref:alpha-amylase family glycosyl hydrolase n=1 Tax=unclassified Methanoculleus TaxID=2619537 RepID=UPI0026001283|nr:MULTISPECIES: alpha-amylase family glycosyl hydrolase [unclassified Methanoculleus]MCK9318678.1 alpha-amylase family glycosyl hydrolase [Methanoculleus sp.]MDD2254541.1 alpha-amylase family glycosyl hydrolase [Methanoculleus sp.]MDD2787104.1 alpha-amylase family glycosyl hydrolase [Methanoculleus sp.]MDD3215977.1 alpha-amylase family glycosyl hydrolase [Methanoculleus sp.]MDD4314101.1 alpha-amylase family glycosyl hydrolase [Methanoculleus sp.]